MGGLIQMKCTPSILKIEDVFFQMNNPVSQRFSSSGEQPELRILAHKLYQPTVAACRLYSNISQILLLYKT